MRVPHFIQALVAVFAAALGSVCVTSSAAREPSGVLFVGNSLTYVGNLPAVFDSIQPKTAAPTESHMLVAAGATLTDRVNDGSLEEALAVKQYGIVVLQERGGDFACGFGPEACANSRQSLRRLARLVRAHGAKPILFGTYQVNREAGIAISREMFTGTT